MSQHSATDILFTISTHFFAGSFVLPYMPFLNHIYNVLVQNSRTQMNTILLMAHTDNTKTWLPDHHETKKNILAYITENVCVTYISTETMFLPCVL